MRESAVTSLTGDKVDTCKQKNQVRKASIQKQSLYPVESNPPWLAAHALRDAASSEADRLVPADITVFFVLLLSSSCGNLRRD